MGGVERERRDRNIVVRAEAEGRGRDAAQDPREPLVVAIDDDAARRAGAPREVAECLVEPRLRAIVLDVLVVDIGDDRDVGMEEREVAEGFAGLRHEMVAGADTCAPVAEGGNIGADHESGRGARRLEHLGDHRRGRRLAVRAGDQHGCAVAPEAVEALGAAQHRDGALLCLRELDIVGGDGVARHHQRRVGDIVGAVSERDVGAQRRQAVGLLRPAQVAAGDAPLHADERLSKAAHARPADADEMHPLRNRIVRHVSSHRCRLSARRSRSP